MAESPNVRQLLEESEQHWDRLATGRRALTETHGPTSCPLCLHFAFGFPADEVCRGCPVYRKTGRTSCAGTPYQDANEAWNDGGYDTPRFQRAAALERDWLKALKEELQ